MNPVFFMHIPKTAGTAFRSFLEAAVQGCGGTPAPFYGVYPSYEEFVASAADLGEKYQLICGHYPYRVRELLPPGTEVVTVVRDPVERCLSHVKHQIEHERLTGTGCGVSDLDGFLELPVNRFFLATLRNLTVKYLCYDGPPNAAAQDHELSLADAKAHCERCWIGLTHSLAAFEETLLGELLPAPGARPPSQRLNRSRNRCGLDDLSPANRDRLRALCPLDLRLYEWLEEREAAGMLPRGERLR